MYPRKSRSDSDKMCPLCPNISIPGYFETYGPYNPFRALRALLTYFPELFSVLSVREKILKNTFNVPYVP